MTALLTIGGGIVVPVIRAVVGAFLGYRYRRSEYLREQRLDAYRTLVDAYIDAARTGAVPLVVHMQTGWPDQLSASWSEKDRAAMTEAHEVAFSAADNARNAFQKAAASGELLWGGDVLREMDAMRSFLHDALYSGPPWIRSNAVHYPTASLDPRDIEPKATEVAAPFVRHGRQVLWGRDEPRARSVAVARLDAPRHRVVIDASASPLMGSEQRSRASSLPVRRDPAPHRAVDAVTPARRERRAAAA